MRRVLLTLVIIILASSIYIGYNWATTEDDDRGKASNMPETVQNESNDEKMIRITMRISKQIQ